MRTILIKLIHAFIFSYLAAIELISIETVSRERSNGHVFFISEPGLLSQAPDTCNRKAVGSYPVILETSEEWTDTKVSGDLNKRFKKQKDGNDDGIVCQQTFNNLP